MPSDNVTQMDLKLLMDTYKDQIHVTEHVLHAITDQTKQLKESLSQLGTTIQDVNAGVKKLYTAIESARRDSIKEHAEIRNRIYLALVGMISIIAVVITSMVK